MMNEIWANRLVAGTKTWTDVPASRKNGVKAVLRGRVANETITPERYEEIIEEVYEAQ